MNRNLGIAAFTIIETAGIIIWRVLIRNMQGLLGVLVLLVGFIGEHFVAFKVLVNTKFPVKRLSGISISEALIWIVWLPLFEINALLGITFFTVSMYLQHSVERNIFLGRPLLENLFKKEIILFTAVESFGANVWLGLFNTGHEAFAAAVLGSTLTVEHFIQADV